MKIEEYTKKLKTILNNKKHLTVLDVLKKYTSGLTAYNRILKIVTSLYASVLSNSQVAQLVEH